MLEYTYQNKSFWCIPRIWFLGNEKLLVIREIFVMSWNIFWTKFINGQKRVKPGGLHLLTWWTCGVSRCKKGIRVPTAIYIVRSHCIWYEDMGQCRDIIHLKVSLVPVKIDEPISLSSGFMNVITIQLILIVKIL